jgi:hypothetical protein
MATPIARLNSMAAKISQMARLPFIWGEKTSVSVDFSE